MGKRMYITSIVLVLVLVGGCSPKIIEPGPINLLDFSLDVMETIKNEDLEGLSAYVHETKGLRFTPYPYVDVASDLVFSAKDLVQLKEDTSVYRWGTYDGSGFNIDLKFSDYYKEFIYNVDFLNPHIIGNNVSIGFVNNILEAYPEASFIEYHFTGFDPIYEGIDRESLILVFEKENENWYLIGIIHGQATV